MKNVIVIIFAALLVQVSNANTYVANGGAQTIKRLIPSWAGDAVSFTASRAPQACTSPYYKLQKSYAGFKENYSIMLLAHATGRNVTVVTFGCDTHGSALIKSIYLD